MTGATEGGGRLLQFRDRFAPKAVSTLHHGEGREQVLDRGGPLAIGTRLHVGDGPSPGERIGERDVVRAEVIPLSGEVRPIVTALASSDRGSPPCAAERTMAL